MRHNRGFTLIEVLIVIAILAAVILLAAPLTGSWTADASIQESEGQLKEAIGRAKSIAQRNQMMAVGETPVAAICISDTKALTVRKGGENTPPSCAVNPAGTQVWQAQISQKVAVKNGVNTVSCICFNNKGLISTAGNCAACTSSTELNLAVGNQSETFNIF